MVKRCGKLGVPVDAQFGPAREVGIQNAYGADVKAHRIAVHLSGDVGADIGQIEARIAQLLNDHGRLSFRRAAAPRLRR
jgi:hypothetical protein